MLPCRQKLGLRRGLELRPVYGHLGQSEPVVQPAALGIIVILGGRFLFEGKVEREVGGDERGLANSFAEA